MLFALCLEYPDELVTDFWRFYGRGWQQIREAGASWEEIAALAAGLPRESATKQALLPTQEIEEWDANTYLLALVVDLLAGANWQRSGRETGKPSPIPRPKPRAFSDVGFDSVDDFRAWYESQPGGRPLGVT